jgi:hypothetical protein
MLNARQQWTKKILALAAGTQLVIYVMAWLLVALHPFLNHAHQHHHEARPVCAAASTGESHWHDESYVHDDDCSICQVEPLSSTLPHFETWVINPPGEFVFKTGFVEINRISGSFDPFAQPRAPPVFLLV